MNKKISSSEKKDWLVKSSMKVLGPFTFDDIVDLLKNKSINIVDEVRRTEQRWLSIREHRDFIATVQALQFEQDAGELTMTTAMQTSSNPSGMTKTEPVTLVNDDLTPFPIFSTQPGFDNKSSNEEGLKNVTSTREVNSPKKPAHLTGKAYGLQNDVRLQREIEKKSSSTRFILVGLSIAVVLLFVGYSAFQNQKKNQDFEKRVRLALRYKNLQLYDQSLNEYKKAVSYKELDFATQSQIAPLLIAFEGETLKGRKILEKSILQPGHSKEQTVEDYVGIGLSYLIENNLKDAEDSFNKALSFDKNHLAANLNLAWIKYTQKSYSEALKLLQSLQIPPQPMLTLAEAMVVAEDWGQTKNTENIDQVLQKLQISVRGTQELKAEQMLMAIYLLQKKGSFDSAIPYMKKVLDEPVQAQSYFVEDPLVYKKWIDGPQWDKYCNEIQTQNATSSLSRVTSGYCLLNRHKDSEASRAVDIGMKQNAKDPYNMLAQLAIFSKTNRVQEATALMGFAEIQDFKSPKWIQGKLCLEKEDYACAQKSFSDIIAKSQYDIYARGGLASVYYRQGKKSESLNAVRTALADEPLFLPLLELRDILESQ